MKTALELAREELKFELQYQFNGENLRTTASLLAEAVIELVENKHKLQADLKEALDVIRFYAEEKFWDSMQTIDINADFGKRAREFITRYEGKGKE